MDKKCYYNNLNCEGDLWQCLTCKENFCQNHFHTTTKGTNQECIACEHQRFNETE